MKKILIVVDYQNDFVSPTGALPVPNADTIANNIQSRINSDDYSARIYTFDTHTKKDYSISDEAKIFPIHCEFETDGWNFYDIKPRYEDWNDYIEGRTEPFDMFVSADEYFFTKDVFNIWDGNDTYPKWFESTFSSDEYEIDVVGCTYEFCVKMNILGMLERGYKVNLITDCVASITLDGEIEACELMTKKGLNFI